MRRSLIAVLAAVALTLAGVEPAAADDGGASRGRSREKPDFVAPGGIFVPSPGGPTLPGSNATVCTAPDGTTGPITHQTPPEPQQFYRDNAEKFFGLAAGTVGTWWLRFCGGARDQIVFVPGAGEGPSLAMLQEIAELAVDGPEIHTSPSEDRRQLVNLRTWLWVDDAPWQPVRVVNSETPGLVIELTAKREKVVWNMGDGTPELTCGQGTAYDPSRPESEQTPTCSHVYRRSSAGTRTGTFRVTATTTWTATYTVNGAPGTIPLPPVEETSEVFLTVAERQALNG